MKPHDVRRTNLLRLIDERFEGKAGRLADAIGKKRPLVYRLFSEKEESRREIGEGFAREIEQKLGLPSGWLDQPSRQGKLQDDVDGAYILYADHIDAMKRIAGEGRGAVAMTDAAAFIERKADDYAREFGTNDMGSLSFGNEDMRIYHWHLVELADEIRALAAPSASAQQAERCNCCGYLVTESEHRGCLRAAAPAHASPAALTDAQHTVSDLRSYARSIRMIEDNQGTANRDCIEAATAMEWAALHIEGLSHQLTKPRIRIPAGYVLQPIEEASALLSKAQDPKGEREAFEAWLATVDARGFNPKAYSDQVCKWNAWQARALLAESPADQGEDARARFEEFWRQEMNVEAMDLCRTDYPMTASADQQYKCHETNRAWITWQAALGTNKKGS